MTSDRANVSGTTDVCVGGGPVNDRIGDIGVAVWIALRRAHQSGVTNLAGQWGDFGSPVPGYVADALDRLTSSGQLALAVALRTRSPVVRGESRSPIPGARGM